ncbi:HNH endonuclease [Variovorax sp. RA8]|uniref:HNH endonuclease n=1 Tax=Variovorax sp. (strain JCM 16519 / RA8) TaxID=662548 RepID=UPI0013A59701|nr:HNH endonuclease [Variovorax sp. RA8]
MIGKSAPPMSVETYQQKFARLNVNVAGGRASPHKICMLLAVLDLARSGGLTENRIFYAPPLLERYARFFDAVRSPTDHRNPYFPFFHLSGRLRGAGESFWHLHAVPGREDVLGAMDTARSNAAILENVAFASLDEELFQLLQTPENVEALGDALSTAWFDRGLSELRVVVAQASEISRYEHQLRAGPSLQARPQAPPAYVRDPAFRRVVTELYDYRCAATGLRLVLLDGTAMVEAAHIHPFSEAQDDDPRNGLALTPNMHWAMDHDLIAPGPDFKWHVASRLDSRIADHRPLIELAGKDLIKPREPRMYPKLEALQWRVARLEAGN